MNPAKFIPPPTQKKYFFSACLLSKLKATCVYVTGPIRGYYISWHMHEFNDCGEDEWHAEPAPHILTLPGEIPPYDRLIIHFYFYFYFYLFYIDDLHL